MHAEEGKAVIRRVYEAINDGRLDDIDPLIASDFPGVAGRTGPAAFRQNVEALRTGFPDVRFSIEDLVAERDRIVVRWIWHGTHTGPFRGLGPSGRHVSNSGIAIYQIRDGRVANVWLETDRLGVLEQVGAAPKPAAS